MFKTSDECDLELVSFTVARVDPDDDIGGDVDDMMPVRAARASFGKQDKTGDNPKADIKLMNFLAEHGHLTPFEYQHATFLIECPLFIRSQIHRHRTFSYNEISRRYTEENLAFWEPDEWRQQHSSSKQASAGRCEDQVGIDLIYKDASEAALAAFYQLLDRGVCREQARAILPQGLRTQFYMGGNLRNWAHFLQLRKDAHAQKEVQVVADKIDKKLRELWPESMQALMGEYEPLS